MCNGEVDDKIVKERFLHFYILSNTIGYEYDTIGEFNVDSKAEYTA